MKKAIDETKGARQRRDAGFTLVEALTAIVILVFGLIAVTNLMIVAANTNLSASQMSASAAVASQVLETLKATPFVPVGGGPALVAGGNTTADVGATATCSGTIAAGVYNCDQTIPGVGRIHARWAITAVPGNAQLFYIIVRAEVPGFLSTRTRSEFTTLRACTTPIPPTAGGACASAPCCPFPP